MYYLVSLNSKIHTKITLHRIEMAIESNLVEDSLMVTALPSDAVWEKRRPLGTKSF